MTIDPFAALEAETLDQARHGELPEWLAAPILAVARNPGRYTARRELVEQLREQVAQYDPYAEAGCVKWACDAADLQRTLAALDA